MKRINAKKITGFVLKFAVAAVVLAFLGLHSINFFMFVFPANQEYYAWMGFGLTGGGAVAYLVVFLWEADTVLRKWISIAIAGVSFIGEVLTALFGMRVEAWTRAGFAMTESDFDYMLLAVGLLALAHASALIGYFAGDQIAELFGDEDGDGTPNYKDKDYKVKNIRSNNQQQNRPSDTQRHQGATQEQKPRTSFTISDLERKANMSLSQVIAQYPTKKAFKDFAAETFDHIDGENLHQLWTASGAANPTQAATANNNHRR